MNGIYILQVGAGNFAGNSFHMVLKYRTLHYILSTFQKNRSATAAGTALHILGIQMIIHIPTIKISAGLKKFLQQILILCLLQYAFIYLHD